MIRRFKSPLMYFSLGGGLLLVIILSFYETGIFGAVQSGEDTGKNMPVEVLPKGFVSSKNCKSCHIEEYNSWRETYHRTMTQVASPVSVKGPFNGDKWNLHGETYRAFQKGKRFWADLPGPNQSRLEKEIVMVTGSHHMQIYWFASGNSRKLEQFPFVYLLGEEQWIPQKTHFLMEPIKVVSTEPGSWNVSCIKCHVTIGRPRYGGRDNIDSLVGEFGIACEACHGPGEDHIRQYSNLQNQTKKISKVSSKKQKSLINPRKLTHRRSAQVCGQCHGIFTFNNTKDGLEWNSKGFSYRPGDDLHKSRFYIRKSNQHKVPAQNLIKANPKFMEQSFWPDGMVRVSGREFNGMMESPCYQRGELTCISCHELHKSAGDSRPYKEWANDLMKKEMLTDQACLQCHKSFASKVVNHTHHSENSPGSQCTNCHMPYSTYGLLKAIRSHQISNPTVAESTDFGRPNACNQCHLDKTLDWTANYLEKWYQVPKPQLSSDEKSVAASLLWLLRGDAGQRALIAWSMGWEPARRASGKEWMPPYLAQLLVDPYDAVRLLAYWSLRTLPSFRNFDYDFVASEVQRLSARNNAIQIWNQRSQKDKMGSDSVLITRQGIIKETIFQRLLRERDDRPVNLAE